ncbi:MAG: hypothetical protein V1676_00135 [Candidatus Diapherotrites archaeon]
MKRAVLVLAVLLMLCGSASAGFWDPLNDLGKNFVDALMSGVKGEGVNFLASLLSLFKVFITTNPDPALMKPISDMVIYIISLFYLLIFLIVGLKFIIGSYDANQRAGAKDGLKKAVLMVIAVNASYTLYVLVLSIGSLIASALWTSELEPLFTSSSISSLNLFLLLAFGGTVLTAFITVVIRYIFLWIGAVLFPIGIFLYLIPQLQSWGKIPLNLIGAALFMQIIDVIILISAWMLETEFSAYPEMVGWAPTIAFSLIAITNICIMLFAIINAALAIVSHVPVLNSYLGATYGRAIAHASKQTVPLESSVPQAWE